jgi:hemolysin III
VTEIKGVKWNYDRGEVIADGIVHGVGVVLALIGVTALIFYATVWATSGQLAAAWVYGVGLVAQTVA